MGIIQICRYMSNLAESSVDKDQITIINLLLGRRPLSQEAVNTVYGVGDIHSFHPIISFQSSIRGK
jgi:hypothetical protein